MTDDFGASGWTVNGKYDPICLTTNCDGYHLLGGYGCTSGGSTMSKSFTMPTHDTIKFTMMFFFIDRFFIIIIKKSIYLRKNGFFNKKLGHREGNSENRWHRLFCSLKKSW